MSDTNQEAKTDYEKEVAAIREIGRECRCGYFTFHPQCPVCGKTLTYSKPPENEPAIQ